MCSIYGCLKDLALTLTTDRVFISERLCDFELHAPKYMFRCYPTAAILISYGSDFANKYGSLTLPVVMYLLLRKGFRRSTLGSILSITSMQPLQYRYLSFPERPSFHNEPSMYLCLTLFRNPYYL